MSIENYSDKNIFFLFSGQFNGRQMMSPSTRSNDTMSGISSIAPSKHSSSSHSITSVSFKIESFFVIDFLIISSTYYSFFCFLQLVFGVLCFFFFYWTDASPKFPESVCQPTHTLGSRACGGGDRHSRGCKCRESLFNGLVFDS